MNININFDNYNFSRKVITNYNLSNKHPFKKKAGNASGYYQLIFDNTLENDLQVLHKLYKDDIPFKIFGSKTNLYITDNGYNGLFIDMRPYNGKIVFNESSESFTVTGNVSVYEFVNFTMKRGYDFGELTGITGLIGAWVTGNDGYTPSGKAFSDFVKEVTVFDFEKCETIKFTPDENFFSLRESFIRESNRNKTRFFVKEVVLKSKFVGEELVRKKFDAQMDRRKPGLYYGFKEGSAGSLWIYAHFKNITGKSFRHLLAENPSINGNFNGATFSPNGNNHFITGTNTTDKDVAKLFVHTINRVKELYGVELKKEIFILDTDGEISIETFINRNS